MIYILQDYIGVNYYEKDIYKIENKYVQYKKLPEKEELGIDNLFLKKLSLMFLPEVQNDSFFGFMDMDIFFCETNEENNENFINGKFLSHHSMLEYNLNEIDWDDIMKKNDIVCPNEKKVKELYGFVTFGDFLSEFDKKHDTCHKNIMLDVVNEVFSNNRKEVAIILKKKNFVPYHIFVINQTLFLEYREILHKALESYSAKIDFSNASWEQIEEYRFLSDICWNIFLLLKKNEQKKILLMNVIIFDNIYKTPIMEKAFSENNVALVLSSSDFYVIYLSAMLKSIIENASEKYNYDINILESGIQESNKEIIISMVEKKKNMSIRFYNVSEKMAGINLKATGHISVETYYRLLIPEIFQNYEKILFLDSDMTVHSDVAELYNMDVSDCMVAATYDQCCTAFLNGGDKSFKKYCLEKLKLKDIYEYFQAGVMLLNLNRMREKYSQEEIFEIATVRQYRYVDQDIMNVLCQGEVKHIPLYWNCFPDFGRYDYEFMPYYLQLEYEEARKNPRICHHTGPNKPWNQLFSDNMMTEHFWKYASKSPFYEQILYRTMVDASGYYYSVINGNKKSVRFKRKIKGKIISPIIQKIFPRGTKRRRVTIKFYYKLRGKELPTWELDD